MNRSVVAWVIVASALAVATLATVASRASAARRVANGQAAFHGQAPLVGRVVGHVQALPTSVTRCANCHGGVADAAAAARAATNTGWAASLPRPAPTLDAAWLAQRVSRRGGPASAYDAAALCTLLRSGVDPTHVMVAGVMPRYEVSDAQCVELWSYLTSR